MAARHGRHEHGPHGRGHLHLRRQPGGFGRVRPVGGQVQADGQDGGVPGGRKQVGGGGQRDTSTYFLASDLFRVQVGSK